MHDRDGSASAESPATNQLSSVIKDGVPVHPVPEFDDALAELTERALDARSQRDLHESRLLEEAASLVERLEVEQETVKEQLAQLEPIRCEFELLGYFGAEDLARTEALIRTLVAHHDEVRQRLLSPSLADACALREQRYYRQRESIAETLATADTQERVDGTITALLGIIRPDDAEWAMNLVDELERRLRDSIDRVGLAPVLRFWRQVRGRTGEELAARIQEKARVLHQEISDQVSARDARATIRSLVEDVRKGIEHLDQLGNEERIAMIHLWLGRLRQQQDEIDVDKDTERELHFTFGALNTVRRKLGIAHYFDALNRKFSTNWESYITGWTNRLDDARRKDRLAADQQRLLRQQQMARDRQSEERREEATRRLGFATEALCSRGPAEDVEAEDVEEVRELLDIGVKAGGCQDEEFLLAARSFAAHAWGGEFRGLRRSLKRIGVEEGDFGTTPAVPENRVDMLFRELRPRFEEKRIAIVGGFPAEATRAKLEEGLAVAELRWFEYYREHDESDAAIASIGARGYDAVVLLVRYSSHGINHVKDACKASGVPCQVVDRGCGVTRILRALMECQDRSSRSR